MNDEWMVIEEFPKYKINRKGEVYSTTNRCIMNTKIKKDRVVIRLSKNDKKYERFISRLLATAFISNPENKLQVNHIDEDPLNNNLDNLEWTTPSENTNHGTRNERVALKVRKNVYQYTLDYKFVKKYTSLKSIRNDGFDHGNVSRVCNGINKQHKGFIWSYKKLH